MQRSGYRIQLRVFTDSCRFRPEPNNPVCWIRTPEYCFQETSGVVGDSPFPCRTVRFGYYCLHSRKNVRTCWYSYIFILSILFIMFITPFLYQRCQELTFFQSIDLLNPLNLFVGKFQFNFRLLFQSMNCRLGFSTCNPANTLEKIFVFSETKPNPFARHTQKPFTSFQREKMGF